MNRQLLQLPMVVLAEICRKYRVRELALFSMAVRSELRVGSESSIL